MNHPIDQTDHNLPSRTEIENGIDNELILSRLTPRQRQAVELYRNGFTQEEIAGIMGVDQSTVSRMFKSHCIKSYVLCLHD